MGRLVVMVVAGLVCLIAAGAPHAARADARWGGADLGVEITASPRTAQPGHPVVYDVRVRNNGPGDAVLPVLTIRLPRDVKIINVNVGECGPGRGTGEVVCRTPRDVHASGTGQVVITGLVRPAAHGPLRAQAELTSQIADPHPENNTAEVVTPVAEGADLAVRLASATRTAPPGGRFAITATVSNLGPKTVRDAYVFLEPRRARFVSAAGARCQEAAGFVGCALPLMSAGTRNLIELTFQAPRRAVDTVGARATVYAGKVGDPRPANNSASIRIAATPAVKPAVTPAVTPAVKPAVTPAVKPAVTPEGAPEAAPEVGPDASPGLGAVPAESGGDADRIGGPGHALGGDARRGTAGGEHHAGGRRHAAEQDQSHQRGPDDQRRKPVHSHM
ncbi:hypothetical protein [Microtetraspora malaysiensis]|uniref:hypothetical protein n=1 Tax=Microtetraspora malaysiensis TaxID=161358 RepID=UPI003D8FA2CC